MKIGSVTLESPFALAPMAGMTDTAFRRLVKRRGGCGLVVTEMVRAECERWPGLQIVAHPTVRDEDGLAMSSRNAYLSPESRNQALGLYQALESARRAAANGTEPVTIERDLNRELRAHGLDVDYAAVRDARTLLRPRGTQPTRALIAARVSGVRLIDNMAL